MAESYGLTSASAPDDGLIAGDFPLKTKAVTIKNGVGAVVRGTVLGQITKQVGTTVPGGSNTGNGTVTSVTMGLLAKIGNYLLTCIKALTSKHTAPTTGTKVGTGNGTMTAVTAGARAKKGTYTATCTAAPTGAVSTPTTGTAEAGNTGAGTMTAVTAGASAVAGTYRAICTAAPGGTPTMPTTGTKVGTGNGTMTGVSAGAEAQAGTYKATCMSATVSGSEVFKVVDPDGNRLDDATVGVAYTSAQINFTMNDGSSDFIVGDYFTVLATAAAGNAGTFKVLTPTGEKLNDATVGSAYTSPQLNFTINDGTPDFVVGDEFTVLATAAAGNSGTFKVVNPDKQRLDDATVGAAYASDEINFTINDGSTDFIVGDYFTIAVGNGGIFSVKDPDGYKLSDAEVGVAYSNPQLNFTIGDGAADWVEGDTLTIPVETPSSAIHIKSLAAAVDGSQTVDCILSEDIDATSAAVLKSAYISGDFNQNKLTFGTGHTAASTKAAAQGKNMYWHDVEEVPSTYA
jgi:hypothetical protein